MALQGKGFFIWKIRACEEGDIAAITALAKQAGFEHLIVKIADGAFAYNVEPDGEDLAIPLVASLQAAGIECWGWHYIYGDYPLSEANIAIRRIKETGVTGYIIDAEAEFKAPGKDKAAVIYLDRLRAVHPILPIALCSYRFPSYHPQFPWTEFLTQCDFNMPQVYWLLAHNPAEQLNHSVNEFRSIIPYRKIIPVGSAYKANNWEATSDDVVVFLDNAKSLNLSGASFWEWSNCRKYLPDVWETIAEYTWSESSLLQDIVDKLFTALNDHNLDRLTNFYTPNAVHVNSARTVQGTPAIRAWYQTLFNQLLPEASFTLTSYTGRGSSRHLSWTATSKVGNVVDGNDTLALVDGKIAYHFTYFTFS
jgi:hypothetical protein